MRDKERQIVRVACVRYSPSVGVDRLSVCVCVCVGERQIKTLARVLKTNTSANELEKMNKKFSLTVKRVCYIIVSDT